MVAENGPTLGLSVLVEIDHLKSMLVGFSDTYLLWMFELSKDYGPIKQYSQS
jgi:hypothetical protein